MCKCDPWERHKFFSFPAFLSGSLKPFHSPHTELGHIPLSCTSAGRTEGIAVGKPKMLSYLKKESQGTNVHSQNHITLCGNSIMMNSLINPIL